MNPLDVRCYRCGSPVGEPCRTVQDREPNRSGVYGYRGAGEVAKHFHRVRQAAASTGGVRTAHSYLVAEVERLAARETALTAALAELAAWDSSAARRHNDIGFREFARAVLNDNP